MGEKESSISYARNLNLVEGVQIGIKTRPAGGKPPLSIAVIEKTFSHRPTKPPNPCPTLTQGHRCPVRTGPGLLTCALAVGHTRQFF